MLSQLIVIGGGPVPARIIAEILARSRAGLESVVGVCTLASSCLQSSLQLPGALFASQFPSARVQGFDFLPQGASAADFSAKRSHISVLREQANNPQLLKLLESLDVLFLGGGDQRIVLDVLQGTRFLSLLKERFQQGTLVVAGTSAGLQVQSDWALTGNFLQPQPPADSTSEHDDRCTQIALDHTELVAGFGLLSGVILDQHFIVRGRQNRLISAVLSNPNFLGIGVDEQTALCVAGVPGEPASNIVVGESGVFYIDASVADIQTCTLPAIETSNMSGGSSGGGSAKKSEKRKLQSATGFQCGIVFESNALPFALRLRKF